MYLAGDIGGTKALLALYKKKDLSNEPIKKKKFASKEYSSLTDIIKEFLTEEERERVVSACFGIAAPVDEEEIKTPNLPWKIKTKELEDVLKIKKVYFLNDLVAAAYGLFTLEEKDVVTLHPGEISATGNMALVSAGTGLGEAGILAVDGKKIPFPSEGGHANFAPSSEEEAELLLFLQKKYKDHVSIERVVSGQGLENIYTFFTEEKKYPKIASSSDQKRSLASRISEEGLAEKNEACVKSLDLFCSIFGSEVGDVALRFLALGGLFIGGGIAPKLLQVLKKPLFLEAFSKKGRMKDLLLKIPIKVVMNEELALRGAVYFLNQQHI